MKYLTCLAHIDASLLSFQFKEPVYVDVKYATEGQNKPAQVYGIEIPPSVLNTINNMPEFIRTCEEAAAHNAEQYWVHQKSGLRPASNLPRVLEQALSPFFNR